LARGAPTSRAGRRGALIVRCSTSFENAFSVRSARVIAWGFTNDRWLGVHNRLLASLRPDPRFVALLDDVAGDNEIS
jgi:hypothetical protein